MKLTHTFFFLLSAVLVWFWYQLLLKCNYLFFDILVEFALKFLSQTCKQYGWCCLFLITIIRINFWQVCVAFKLFSFPHLVKIIFSKLLGTKHISWKCWSNKFSQCKQLFLYFVNFFRVEIMKEEPLSKWCDPIRKWNWTKNFYCAVEYIQS